MSDDPECDRSGETTTPALPSDCLSHCTSLGSACATSPRSDVPAPPRYSWRRCLECPGTATAPLGHDLTAEQTSPPCPAAPSCSKSGGETERTRLAIPRRVRGNSEPVRKPQYSTAVGLLYFSAKNDDLRPKSKGARSTSFGSIVTAVKEWFGFGV